MRKWQRSLVVVSLVAWVGLALTGAAAAQTPVRVSGWGGTDLAIVEELIARFVRPAVEAEGIQVIYEPVADSFDTYLYNALSAGTAPDLFYVDIFWSEPLFRAGQVEPLNQYLTASNRLSADDIIPNLLEGFTIDGQIYGIPKDMNTLAVIYNKDLFDEAGVPYPDENDDWNTFTEKLRRVVEATGVEGTGPGAQPALRRRPHAQSSQHGPAGEHHLHRLLVHQRRLQGEGGGLPGAGGADQPRGPAVGVGAGPGHPQPGRPGRQPLLR
ncbi:extracellular solute-binding protein [Limnochorda sp.]